MSQRRVNENLYGLFAGDSEIPLLGVRVEARLDGMSSEVIVTQRYKNREEAPVEAVYVFPLEEESAVCGFAARIGNKIVRGSVEERDKAFEIYDDAMADGHGAFLLDQERPNVFTASVGNLRPDEEVSIEIRYVALARREGEAVRLTIPTTVSPRYMPAGTPAEIGEPDGERVNPEHRFEVPYGLELRVDVDGLGELRSVESPSHPIRTRLQGGDGATVELAHEQAALDRDFVLLAEMANPHRPLARLAREDDGSHVAMLTFLPTPATGVEGSEVIFVLDCSGSMNGTSIAEAKRALALSVRALGERDTFNIVRFGSHYEKLWARPHRFDQQSLDKATRHIEAIRADLGGTEILQPLREVLGFAADPERRRQILLLTDGQVSNEHQVIDLARSKADKARIFTFGIGAGASEYLVRELARVSDGAAEFIFPGERIEPKVLRMFDRVRTPGYDVRLDWGGLEIEQAPAKTPPVFANDSLTVFGHLAALDAKTEVELTAGDESWALTLDPAAAREAPLVPTLWARQRIRDIESGSDRGSSQRRSSAERRHREQLVDLGKRYGLMSSATSYVAVEERAEDDKTNAPAELRKIPIALTTGWGGLRGHGVSAVAMGPAMKVRSLGADPMEFAALSQAPPAAMASAASSTSEIRRRRGSHRTDFGGKDIVPSVGRDSLARSTAAQRSQDREAVRLDASDRLYDVLMTQNADGSFALSEVLKGWLGTALAEVEKAVAQHGETLVATAVVLALLERDEASREDEWRPAARKARQWLTSRDEAFDPAYLLAA